MVGCWACAPATWESTRMDLRKVRSLRALTYGQNKFCSRRAVVGRTASSSWTISNSGAACVNREKMCVCVCMCGDSRQEHDHINSYLRIVSLTIRAGLIAIRKRTDLVSRRSVSWQSQRMLSTKKANHCHAFGAHIWTND